MLIRPQEAIAYFYFDYQQSVQQTPQAFVANILRQFVSQKPSLPVSLLTLYDQRRQEDVLEYSGSLCEILTETVSCFETCFIIIDALDECSNASHRKSIMKMLSDSPWLGVRIFMTSRPHCSEIQTSLSDASHLLIKAHDDDIRAYCASALEMNDDISDLLDDDLREQCINNVAAQAQGMYVFLLPFLSVIERCPSKLERKMIKRFLTLVGFYWLSCKYVVFSKLSASPRFDKICEP